MSMTIYNLSVNATINTKPAIQKLKTKWIKAWSCWIDYKKLPNLLTYNQQTVETDLTGLRSGSQNSQDTLIRDTSNPYKGLACAKVTSNYNGYQWIRILSSVIQVKPNTWYKAFIRLKSDVIGSRIRFQLYNASFQDLPAVSKDVNGQWQYYEVIFNSGSNTGVILYSIVGQEYIGASQGQSLWWDEAYLVELPSGIVKSILKQFKAVLTSVPKTFRITQKPLFSQIKSVLSSSKSSLKVVSVKSQAVTGLKRFLIVKLEGSQVMNAVSHELLSKTLHGFATFKPEKAVLVLKRLHANLKGLTSEHTLNLRTFKAETAMNATVDIYQYFLKKFYQVKIQTSKHYKVRMEKVKQFKMKVEGKL